MAFTSTQLEELKAAYAAGVLTVRHGDKTVQYASMDDLWTAILRLERALQPSTKKYTHGVIRFRQGS